MRLGDYLKLLRSRMVIVAVTIGVVTVVSLGMSLGKKATYTADVQLRLRPRAPGSGAEAQIAKVDPTDVNTEVALVTSEKVSQQVAKLLKLNIMPQRLGHLVTVGVLPRSSIMGIQARSLDPAFSVVLANTYANAYLQIRREDTKRELDALNASLAAELKVAQQRLNGFDARLAKLTLNSSGYIDVKNDRDSALADLVVLRSRITATADQATLARGFGDITQPAREAKGKRASKARTGVFGVLVGIPLALAVVLILDSLSDTLRSQEEAEEHTGSTVLALVPFDDTRTAPDAPLATEADPFSPLAESYRTLRHNLMRAAGETVETILITSPGSGEGKTTTVANLALSYAESGSQIAAIEADLRRPDLANRLGGRAEPGFTDLLAGRSDISDVLQYVRPRLGFIPAGIEDERPDLVLYNGDIPGSFDHIKLVMQSGRIRRKRKTPARSNEPGGDGDRPAVILLDGAPVLQAAEVSALASQVDGVVLVVQAGVTRRQAAARAAEQIRRAGGTLLGVVMTGVPPSADSSVYAGYTAYPPRPRVVRSQAAGE